MADIILSTINARYQHTSLALRYLKQNLQTQSAQVKIIEFSLQDTIDGIIEQILYHKPQIVACGIYIWNVSMWYNVLSAIKVIAPNTTVIIGGPEIAQQFDSHASLQQVSDIQIAGEAEFIFHDIVNRILAGQHVERGIHVAPPASLELLQLPYHLYSQEDIEQRVIYIETSRGCPYHCDFCTSGDGDGVRRFARHAIVQAVMSLYERGARTFRFLDRCFDVSLPKEVFSFFIEHQDVQLHFEVMPHGISPVVKEFLSAFTSGKVQCEVGLQSLQPHVLKEIGREYDQEKAQHVISYLSSLPHVHVHADLIIGLPGERITEIAENVDELWSWGVDEIQIGILKKLPGTNLHVHDHIWQMKYRKEPPYDILQTKYLSFEQLQHLKHFSRYWHLLVNNGHFPNTMRMLFKQGAVFETFYELSEFCYQRFLRSHAISVDSFAKALASYFVGKKYCTEQEIQALLQKDYQQTGKKKLPLFCSSQLLVGSHKKSGWDRQDRHHNKIP